MRSMTVTGWSGESTIPLPVRSVTAPVSMSSCGAAILLTIWLWVVESVTVMVVYEGSKVLLVMASSARPPKG